MISWHGSGPVGVDVGGGKLLELIALVGFDGCADGVGGGCIDPDTCGLQYFESLGATVGGNQYLGFT